MIVMQFGEIDKCILFGGGRVLAELANDLKKRKIDVEVVTSARHLQENLFEKDMSLEEFLEQNQLPYLASENVNNDIEVHKLITPTALGLSLGAAWIFRKKFIDRFQGRLINGHSTRLPQNRGGGGYSWQILYGNRLGASLVHLVDTGIDTGNIVDFREYVFPQNCRIPIDYERHAFHLNMVFFTDLFSKILTNEDFECTQQQEMFSTYWPRLSTLHQGLINWSWSLEHLDRFICAFDDPYAGASTFLNGQKVFLKKSFIGYQDGSFHPFQIGIVYRKTVQGLFIATTDGSLIVSQLADDNGQDLLPSVRIGDRFYTPHKHLEEAQLYRPVYNAQGLKK